MFTTGTKLLIGATALAVVGAIVYGVTQDGAMGTIGLVSAACALAFLAGVNLYTRDSNVDAADASAVATAPAGRPAPGPSVWPLGFAFGGVVIAVGLISYQTIVVIGLVVVLATGVRVARTAATEFAAGVGAGTTGLVASMGGPPLALIYSSEEAATIRSTLGAVFTIGVTISVVVRAVTGNVTSTDVQASLLLFPAVVIGYVVSIPLTGRITNSMVRNGILTVSAIAGVALIVRALPV